jgi:twitching motility two-component system response regulator PilH
MPTQSAHQSIYVDKVSQSLTPQGFVPVPAGLADWQIKALQKFTAGEPLLVTDDDVMSRKYYYALLAQTFGLKLIETWDPDEALRICRTQPIGLVISCIIKPQTMDGLKLASDLRADSRTRAIPLLFITASANTRDLAYEAGADAYLSKPCHPNEILQEIWQLLRGRVL